MTNVEYGQMVIWWHNTELPERPQIVEYNDWWVIKDGEYARIVAKDNNQVVLEECSCWPGATE